MCDTLSGLQQLVTDAAGSCKSCSSATTCQVCTHAMYLNPITQRLGSLIILMLLHPTVYILSIFAIFHIVFASSGLQLSTGSHRPARCTNDCPSDHYMVGNSDLAWIRWQCWKSKRRWLEIPFPTFPSGKLSQKT